MNFTITGTLLQPMVRGAATSWIWRYIHVEKTLPQPKPARTKNKTQKNSTIKAN